jgi:replicative DNA helicase
LNPTDKLESPTAVEAERALLGGLIQRPDLVLQIWNDVKPSDFARLDHQNLYELIHRMVRNDEAVDLVTLPERVMREKDPARYGGVAYVIELPEHAPSTANLPHYAALVREKAVLRRLLALGQDLASEAARHPDDIASLVDRVATELISVGAAGKRGDWVPISAITDESLLRVQDLGRRQGDTIGVTTGYKRLDKLLSGLQPGDLVILAARPSMGKTALALNLALNAAEKGGAGVGIYSLEMGRHQLVDRLLCSLGPIDGEKYRTGRLDADEWELLLEASDKLRRLHISINDTPGLNVAEVRAHALRLKNSQPDLGLLVLDYLQLMGATDSRASRVEQVSEMSRGLKALARDLKVPVLALSQLSRNVEQRADKRPMMSDLRESGAIEQDADVIMFIYRDEYYNADSPDAGLAEVIIAKQRNGPTGTAKLAFQKQFSLFADVADEPWGLGD